MTLATCRKCKRIIASTGEPCPYCGEPEPAAVQTDPDVQQLKSSNKGALFALAALLILLLAQWFFRTDGSREANDNGVVKKGADCLTSACDAGTNAVTTGDRLQPFYTCSSDELSEYANLVLNVMVDRMFAGTAPEISTKTGEPVVHGSDKAMLDQYRQKAHVASFEQAISKCYRGRAGQQVVVLYSPKESKSVYVADAKNRDSKFWLPKARLARVVQ